MGLVGGDWNMTGLFSIQLGMMIPSDSYFFRGIETTNQDICLYIYIHTYSTIYIYIEKEYSHNKNMGNKEDPGGVGEQI